MDIITANPDGSDNRPSYRTAAYNKQSVTSAQVQTLLNILTHVRMTLGGIEHLDGSVSGGHTDGGVTAALEATLLKVSDRLDEILEDKSRWDTEGVDSLEDAVKSVHAQQIATLKAQAESFLTEIRPVILLRPKIFQFGNRWICLHGEEIEGRVFGIGDTPAQAVADFEHNYHNKKNDNADL